MERNSEVIDLENNFYDSIVDDSNIDEKYSASSSFVNVEDDSNNPCIWELYNPSNDHINYIQKKLVPIDNGFCNIQEIENDPYSYFKLFMSDKLLTYIIEKSDVYQKHCLEIMKNKNKLKKRSRILDWKKPTLQEINKYLGIILWMSIHSNSNYRNNWNKSNSLYNTKYNNYMSFDKFFLIHRYIHFGGLDINKEVDPIRKIRIVMDKISKKWKKYYNPGDYLTVDESMIKHTGRCAFLQYIKNKPVRWGVKMYLVSDSVSYYCLGGEIYYGKKNNCDNIQNLTPTETVVAKLLEPYYYLGKIIFCDNFFTSLKLEQYLRDKNVGLVGAMRSNRIPGYKQLKIPDKKFFASYKMKENENFILTIWNDNRVVNIMNNAFPVNNYLKTRKNRTIVIPSIINKYNQYKHGVDSNNQNTYHYRFPHKSYRWTKNVFFHLIHISIYNAYVIYRKRNPKTTFNFFYEYIILKLLGSKKEKSNNNKIHNIKYIDELTKKRQRCFECKKKTSWCCTVCDDSPVYLCIPDCYNDYHKNFDKN